MAYQKLSVPSGMGALDVSKTCPFHRQPTATSDTSSFTGALEPKTRAQRRQDPANQVSPVFGCEIKINTNIHTQTNIDIDIYIYMLVMIWVCHAILSGTQVSTRPKR